MRILTFLCATLALACSARAELIAYWDQNSNVIPETSVFGFFPSSFPQPASQGAGALTLANFDETVNSTGTNAGAYSFIESFSGTDLNAQPGIATGGSLTPEGATNNANNGMSILLSVSTLGFEDIQVSWAQRGTSTGFDGRQFAYSTDGVTFTDFGTDAGDLTGTWTLKSYDLSTIAALDNQASVTFRVTLTGATSASGNNRFDNLTVTGTVVPEPASIVVLLVGVAGTLVRRRG